jgi:uncharacterized protein with PhoU and TrkA domain
MVDPQVLLKAQIKGIFPGLKTVLVAVEDGVVYDVIKRTVEMVQKVNPDAVEIGRQGDILIHRGLLTA